MVFAPIPRDFLYTKNCPVARPLIILYDQFDVTTHHYFILLVQFYQTDCLYSHCSKGKIMYCIICPLPFIPPCEKYIRSPF